MGDSEDSLARSNPTKGERGRLDQNNTDVDTAALALVRGGLRFSQLETERAYQAWHLNRAIPFTRSAMANAAVAWLLVLLAYRLSGLSGFGRASQLVLLIIGPLIVACMAMTYRPRLRGTLWSTTVANAVAGLLIVALSIDFAHRPDIGMGGVTVSVFVAFVVFRLHPLQAVLSVVPCMAVHEYLLVDAFVAGRLGVAELASYSVIPIVAFAQGLPACMSTERALRETFRDERIIEAQKETIAKERARSEALLKREVSHQVAERSRELGEVLARAEARGGTRALSPGERFDARYRVVRPLGAGAMGAVYEVERLTDSQRYALKVITSRTSSANAARFAREAEIGARLHHENLVSIVDVGIAAGGTPFLVMELVPGGSLEDERARFGDARWALPILRQIAAGLAELHAHSVIHRDLKPPNVLLVTGDGAAPTAKISDFGISRFDALDVDAEVGAVSPGSSSPDATPSGQSPRNLTETGAFIGTPLFMPPEAWFGPTRHPSADVFSFGVLAYEMLSGRRPFAVPPISLVRSREPIPAPAPIDGVDPNVAALVLACLRVEPKERPRARALADQL